MEHGHRHSLICGPHFLTPSTSFAAPYSPPLPSTTLWRSHHWPRTLVSSDLLAWFDMAFARQLWKQKAVVTFEFTAAAPEARWNR